MSKISLILVIAMQALGQRQTSSILSVQVEPRAMLTTRSLIVMPAGSTEGTVSIGYKVRTSSVNGSGMLALSLTAPEQQAISYTCLGTATGTPCSEPKTMGVTATPVIVFGSDSHSSEAGDTVDIRWHSDAPLSREVVVAFTITAN